MNRFVVALSAVVSGRSAWLILGVSGMAYVQGVSAIWAVLGYTMVEFFLFFYYAPKIRNFAEKHDCITIPDFFAARFQDKNGILRILLVFIFLLFMVSYIAAQFAAGGKAFFAHFSITQSQGLIITAAIVLFYTLLGGFLAVSYTDVAQGIMMILALVILPVVGFFQFEDKSVFFSTISENNPGFISPFSIGAITLIGYLGIGLGSPGNPHILVRYMSIKNSNQFKWTAMVGTIWNLLMGVGAVAIGLVGRAYFTQQSMLPGEDVENIFLSLAGSVFPAFVVSLLLASVFAAIMSTADSQLLVAASSIARDLYQKVLKKDSNIPQKKLSIISRVSVLILVIIAVLLGMFSSDLVFWFVLFAWGGLGAAIGPTSILALFWKKTTKKGVVAGLVSGTGTVFIWKSIPVLDNFIYELIPGFLISLILTWTISLLDQPYKPKR